MIPPPYGKELTWKERTRRAEAETSVARMIGAASDLLYEARNKVLLREIEEMKNSTSWRITAPLRRFTRLFRRRRRGSGAAGYCPRARRIFSREKIGSPRCFNLEIFSATPKALDSSMSRSSCSCCWFLCLSS